MTNSVPDTFGLAISTPHGNIVYTTEFIVDYDISIESFSSDIVELAEIGKEKTFALLSESVGSTKEGASQKLMYEYSNIVSKYGDSGEQWWTKFEKNISAKDRNRLEQIFKKMNADQQAKQRVAFIKPPQPLKKIIPSEKEFKSWKNGNVYGVWIDEKKIKNSILDKHNNTDFEHVIVSKLYGAAKQNKKYSYQVNLMTKEYCHEYNDSTAKKGTQMVFRA